ncbi:protein SLOW GREEN 1, chloroplastic [Magnolia sinica]|uniref:protein SLOW GREEN 1, chloroplastic n=1 Tax=Magnolia sinica TaxID=86752 RepID=UPI002658B775|nr:protein SLOW GREEN 1, chloroplastic [Magnolia sinica]
MASFTTTSLIHAQKPLPLPFSHSKPLPKTHSLNFSFPKSPKTNPSISVRASSSHPPKPSPNPLLQALKSTSKTLILSAAAAAFIIGKSSQFPANAEPPVSVAEEKLEESESDQSPLSEFLESHTDAVDSLKSLLQQKLEAGEDSEALTILKRLASAQPSQLDWKFLMARLFNEMGETSEARRVFEEILAVNPLSFEALFENALLMDRCGEGDAVIQRLEEALIIAKSEEKEREARDVRLIMAQIQFLQKNVEEALRSYRELAEEDPKDFRPYFCQGVIYSLLDRNKEAREQFSKYHELSPKKFEVEGFLQTPLSRMKLFGSDSEN